MADQQAFEQAQESVKGLVKRPSNDELLQLYSLFKQATEGDVSGKRPGLMDLKGRAKYDAWADRKGMSADQARTQYVDLVRKLQDSYGA